jgi:catalase
VPASYARAPFWAVNTFVFVGEDGRRQPARWVVEPVARVVGLTDEQLKTMPDEFLAEEFRGRLARRPAEWDFHLQFPGEGDPLDDATVAWPADRRKVKVGRLAVTSAAPAGTPGECEREMFDPLLLPQGIEPSNDPVLRPERGLCRLVEPPTGAVSRPTRSPGPNGLVIIRIAFTMPRKR